MPLEIKSWSSFKKLSDQSTNFFYKLTNGGMIISTTQYFCIVDFTNNPGLEKEVRSFLQAKDAYEVGSARKFDDLFA